MRLSTLFPVLQPKKEDQLGRHLSEYMDNVLASVSALVDAVTAFCEGKNENVKSAKMRVISFEKAADNMRRTIESNLYRGVLLPFGREDKYELIEAIDDIADKAELIIRLASLQKPKIPKKLAPDVKQLAKMIEQVVKKLGHAVEMLQKDIDEATSLAHEVDFERDNIRDFEFGILEQLYEGGITSKEAHLKELIVHLAKIADKAEAAADRVITLAVKYQS
jgi:predicted phosphate transport protein (TIGR00153 family)